MNSRFIPAALLIGVSLCLTGGNEQRVPDIRPTDDLRGHRGPVTHLAFQPDGKLLASAGGEGRIRLWDVEKRSLVRQIFPLEKTVSGRILTNPAPRRIEAIGFSADGKVVGEVAVEPPDGAVLRLWDPETGQPIQEFARNVPDLRALAFAPEKKLVAFSMRDTKNWGQMIVIRNRETGETVAELRKSHMAATNLAFSPDGKLLAAAGAQKLYVWDVEAKKLLHDIDAHKKAIQSICFSPNGKLLVTGSTDDSVRIWKVDSGKKDREMDAKQDGVLAVAFSPSGRTIASAGADKTIKMWNPTNGATRHRLWGHLDRVLCLAFSPDGKTLASGSRDTTIALWPNDESDDKEDEADADEEWGDWGDDDGG